MYILLEGGAKRLHNISQPLENRSTKTHVQAFVDPVKAPLYCFRLRRTVQQVTDMYNAPCKAYWTRKGEWRGPVDAPIPLPDRKDAHERGPGPMAGSAPPHPKKKKERTEERGATP